MPVDPFSLVVGYSLVKTDVVVRKRPRVILEVLHIRRARRAYELGDSVKITDGPLEGFIGTVDELEPDKDRVRVVVSMFGRETPVDLELDQVEAIKD